MATPESFKIADQLNPYNHRCRKSLEKACSHCALECSTRYFASPTMDVSNRNLLDTFSHMMHFPYQSFAKFDEDFKTFQQATSTSYSIVMCQKASVYFKETGERLPDCFPYKRLRYACTHARKRNRPLKFARHADMNCTAFISLCVSNELLVLKKGDFVHSHSLQGISPWTYHKNRRLTAEQTEIVHSLLRHSVSTRDILIYIEEQFDRKLNRFDLRRIREKLKEETDLPNSEKMDGTKSDQLVLDADNSCSPTRLDDKSPARRKREIAHSLGTALTDCLSRLDDEAFCKQADQFQRLIPALDHQSSLTICWTAHKSNSTTKPPSNSRFSSETQSGPLALTSNNPSAMRQWLGQSDNRPLRHHQNGYSQNLDRT